MTSRRERAAQAQMLRAQGLLQRQIAEVMNVSCSYVSALLCDPDGAQVRARKSRYAGVCCDCGSPTDGSDGAAKAPKRCAPCYRRWQTTDEYREQMTEWTRRRVIAAIQDWADLYGEPPAVPDWNPNRARQTGDEQRAQRFEAGRPGRWPWFTQVVQRFGSWNAGIAMAGFEPRPDNGGGGNEKRRRKRP